MRGSRAALCLVLVAHLASAAPATAQQELTNQVVRDPATAEFSFTDIENFIRAKAAIAAGADSSDALQREYFDRASPGLLMFIEKYDLTLERLLDAMGKRPNEYERIPELLEALKDREPSFRLTLAAIQRVIPNAVFPPTYFVVSGYRGIGSGSIEGPLISIEKKTSASIREGDVEPTLVHEMIHIQQLAAVGEEYFVIFSGEERTLLALSIREGASTFFAEVISGGSEHKNQARDYYLAHEAELWEAFRADMFGLEMGEWLWEDPSDPGIPRDLGYAIGARIVEAYYESAGDKGVAAREIMSITDYPEFLARSGYSPR
ncbi:hypothetical protein ACFL5T_03655 [Gemmatimonadota bacterium]